MRKVLPTAPYFHSTKENPSTQMCAEGFFVLKTLLLQSMKNGPDCAIYNLVTDTLLISINDIKTGN